MYVGTTVFVVLLRDAVSFKRGHLYRDCCTLAVFFLKSNFPAKKEASAISSSTSTTVHTDTPIKRPNKPPISANRRSH